MRKIASVLLAALTIASASAQDWKQYLPEVHGTVRGKYEYQTSTDEQRFQVRNARVSLDGKVHSLVSYKAEIDLSDEGQIKMLDAFARVTPLEDFKITVGQMRVPFTIDAHRSPHQQYFANRSFIAKQVGNVRDVGATLGYSMDEGFPFILEGGLFSGSGLTAQKEWHRVLCYSAKLQLMPWKDYNLTLSTQRIRPENVNIYMYDIGTYYKWNNWHFEVEGLYKRYAHDSFQDVWAVDAFINYDWFIQKKKFPFKKISFLARFDNGFVWQEPFLKMLRFWCLTRRLLLPIRRTNIRCSKPFSNLSKIKRSSLLLTDFRPSFQPNRYLS